MVPLPPARVTMGQDMHASKGNYKQLSIRDDTLTTHSIAPLLKMWSALSGRQRLNGLVRKYAALTCAPPHGSQASMCTKSLGCNRFKTMG
eukprot:4327897-Amphidinium_carterae.1